MSNRSSDEEGADLQHAWERGEPVELKRDRPPTSVLSIRVPSPLFDELSERARDVLKPVSHVARELIESGLARQGPSTPPDLARSFSRWVEEELQSESIRQDAPGGPVRSFLAGRLAVCGQRVPTVDELELEDLRLEAFAWQGLRSRAERFEMSAIMSQRHAKADRLREVLGLLGIAAELVLVSIEAEIEKETLGRHIHAGACEWPFTHWRALRFFADAQINHLVMAGHTIANAVLGTCALDPRFDATEVDRRLKEKVFQPFSDHRDAWISLNRKTAARMASGSRALGMERLGELGDRLEAFVDSETVRGLLECGEAIGLGPDRLPPYQGAEDAVRELADLGRRALVSFAEFMPKFRELWLDAHKDLTQAP